MTKLSHIDETGRASMVDVTAKPDTNRMARASGSIVMQRSTLSAIRANEVGKGDVLAAARIAGVMAAKRTPEIIPLCHAIILNDIQVELALDESLPGVRVETVVRCTGKTGVEMEALVATSAALLTIYDMAKGMDRSMTVGQIQVEEKSGGRSGTWTR